MLLPYKYDVALSFAEEDTNAAVALSLALKFEGFGKLYCVAGKREATLAQPLAQKLTKIYSQQSRCAVVLLSRNYFDPKKEYTHFEFAAIRERAAKDPANTYMIAVKLNDTLCLRSHPELDKVAYLPWEYNAEEIARVLRRFLGWKAIRKSVNVMIGGKKYLLMKNRYLVK